jgi:hypothetical protein
MSNRQTEQIDQIARIKKEQDRINKVDAIRKEFQTYSRKPFLEILSHFMAAAPTPEAMRVFANDHPDKWAQSIKTISQLYGYHDKLEIKGDLNVQITTMGDAELMDRLAEVEHQLNAKVIDHLSDVSEADKSD